MYAGQQKVLTFNQDYTALGFTLPNTSVSVSGVSPSGSDTVIFNLYTSIVSPLRCPCAFVLQALLLNTQDEAEMGDYQVHTTQVCALPSSSTIIPVLCHFLFLLYSVSWQRFCSQHRSTLPTVSTWYHPSSCQVSRGLQKGHRLKEGNVSTRRSRATPI